MPRSLQNLCLKREDGTRIGILSIALMQYPEKYFHFEMNTGVKAQAYGAHKSYP